MKAIVQAEALDVFPGMAKFILINSGGKISSCNKMAEIAKSQIDHLTIPPAKPEYPTFTFSTEATTIFSTISTRITVTTKIKEAIKKVVGSKWIDDLFYAINKSSCLSDSARKRSSTPSQATQSSRPTTPSISG